MILPMFLQWLTGGRYRHRNIFRYWDGRRERATDPMVVYRAIETDPGFNLEVDPALMESGDREARERAIGVVHRAFGVTGFDAGGLLEDEALQLFVDFFDYLASLKKSISHSPTSSEPTESESSGPAPTLTSSSSDSGRTPSE